MKSHFISYPFCNSIFKVKKKIQHEESLCYMKDQLMLRLLTSDFLNILITYKYSHELLKTFHDGISIKPFKGHRNLRG